MSVIFPLLYGVYLSLGLLVLQPFQNLGLSPMGALCLFVMGSSLMTVLLFLRTRNVAITISSQLARRIALTSIAKVVGIGAFLSGQLLGTDYFFSLMALFYGLAAGTVWFRFARVRNFSFTNRLGAFIASVAVLAFLIFDTRDFNVLGFASAEHWVTRSLTLVGAIFWGISQNVYNPREFGVSRAVWNLWESTFAVLLVLFVAGMLRAVVLDNSIVSSGFLKQPLYIVPFLLFGIVFGILREKLLQAGEAQLSSRVTQWLWVSSAAVSSVGGVTFVMPFSYEGASLLGVVAVVLGLFLLRYESSRVSNYAGIREVDWITRQAGGSQAL